MIIHTNLIIKVVKILKTDLHTTLRYDNYGALHVKRLTLSAPWAKPSAFADGIDQDQTAQNVKSDLGSMQPSC